MFVFYFKIYIILRVLTFCELDTSLQDSNEIPRNLSVSNPHTIDCYWLAESSVP